MAYRLTLRHPDHVPGTFLPAGWVKPSRPHSFLDTLRERWAACPTRERTETMGFTITPIETAGSVTDVPVPDDVAKDLEGLWGFITEKPNHVAHVKFDKADEVAPFLAQAQAWAKNRTVDVGVGEAPIPAPLDFRKLAGKDLPDTEIKFRLRLPLTEDELAEQKAKREANKVKREAKLAAEAKAAASETPTPDPEDPPAVPETPKPGVKAHK